MTAMTAAKPRAYWHIHHETLWEWATEPIENRIEYIRREKPVGEIPTRLRLLKEITDPRFQPVIDALAEYERVTAQAWAEWPSTSASRRYERVLATVDMDALHRELCPDCPWDGKTIFPEATR